MKVLNIEDTNKDLEPFEKNYLPGMFLFHQGFPAETFFIVLKGTVELVSEQDDKIIVVTYVGPGSCLGERLLVETGLYPRAFGARALTEVKCIEIRKDILNNLHLSSPRSLVQILSTSLEVCINRLARMNSLISHLRSFSSRNRLLYLILFFYNNHGRFLPQGKEVVLQEDMIRFYIDVPRIEIQKMLLNLQTKKIIKKTRDSIYLITNEAALRDLISNSQPESDYTFPWELTAA